MTIAQPGTNVVKAPMRIGGKDVITDEWIDVINPADIREVVGRVPAGTAAHSIAATEAAAKAFPIWSAMPPAERAAAHRAAGQALLADAEARAVLLARECGCLMSEARGGVIGCTRAMDYYAKVGETFHFEEELPSPNGRVIVVRESMGVSAVIVPWNSPTYLGYLALGPVLMAGNTVVVKPPTDAPLALMDSLRVIEPFFPDGTINWVTGPGSTVGAALLTAPLVRKVNFTGSSEVGKDVLRDGSRPHQASLARAGRQRPGHRPRGRRPRLRRAGADPGRLRPVWPDLLRRQADLRPRDPLSRLRRPVHRGDRRVRRGQRARPTLDAGPGRSARSSATG